MASKLKVIEDVADIVPAPKSLDFDIAPTRKRNAGWTAERQRKFHRPSLAHRQCRRGVRLGRAFIDLILLAVQQGGRG